MFLFIAHFMKMHLEISLLGTIVFLVIQPFRFLTGCISKKCSYILWSVFWLRLILPFTIRSPFSIIHFLVYANGNNASADCIVPGNVYTILFIVWMTTSIILLIVFFLPYKRLKKDTKKAILTNNGCLMLDNIETAFVFGIIKPKIFIPSNVSSNDLQYVFLHESCHIRRGDHIIKIIVTFITIIHWFNPIVWIAFVLFKQDMESSCDEMVLDIISKANAADYASVLVKWSNASDNPSVFSVNLGGGVIKKRIKNIAKYKPVSKYILILTFLVGISLMAACSLKTENSTESVEEYESIQIGNQLITLEGIPLENAENLISVFYMNRPEKPFRISGKGICWIWENGKWVTK